MSEVEVKKRLKEILMHFKECHERRGLRSCEECEGWCRGTMEKCCLREEDREFWDLLSAHPDIFMQGPRCLEEV
jgi:hypothetical protein